MSRSGYSDDCDDNWALIRWRGAVNSALNGKRGQAFLSELAAAMDAMPDKILIEGELESNGCFCTLGVIGNARGIDMSTIDPDDRDQVGKAFNISPAMAAEIVYMNDEFPYNYETPTRRWERMRAWVSAQLKPTVQV